MYNKKLIPTPNSFSCILVSGENFEYPSNIDNHHEEFSIAHLTDIIMFKQGQKADLAAVLYSLKQSHVAISRVELYVIIKHIRNRSATEQQVDQLL